MNESFDIDFDFEDIHYNAIIRRIENREEIFYQVIYNPCQPDLKPCIVFIHEKAGAWYQMPGKPVIWLMSVKTSSIRLQRTFINIIKRSL